MLNVDRYDFARANHYMNRPQSIGFNVTISAPHMHALALEYLYFQNMTNIKRCNGKPKFQNSPY